MAPFQMLRVTSGLITNLGNLYQGSVQEPFACVLTPARIRTSHTLALGTSNMMTPVSKLITHIAHGTVLRYLLT